MCHGLHFDFQASFCFLDLLWRSHIFAHWIFAMVGWICIKDSEEGRETGANVERSWCPLKGCQGPARIWLVLMNNLVAKCYPIGYGERVTSSYLSHWQIFVRLTGVTCFLLDRHVLMEEMREDWWYQSNIDMLRVILICFSFKSFLFFWNIF